MVDTYVQGQQWDTFTAACDTGWLITDIFNATYAKIHSSSPAECTGCLQGPQSITDLTAVLTTACVGKQNCTLSSNDVGLYYSGAPLLWTDPCVGSYKRAEFSFR